MKIGREGMSPLLRQCLCLLLGERLKIPDILGGNRPFALEPTSLGTNMTERIGIILLPLSSLAAHGNNCDLARTSFLMQVPIHLGGPATRIVQMFERVDFARPITFTRQCAFHPIAGLKPPQPLLLDLGCMLGQ